MKLTDILKGSEYSLILFQPENITNLENRIITKANKKGGEDAYVTCIVRGKEIKFILLDNFADWEGAYIAPSLNFGCESVSKSKYVVKTNGVGDKRARYVVRRLQGIARL